MSAKTKILNIRADFPDLRDTIQYRTKIARQTPELDALPRNCTLTPSSFIGSPEVTKGFRFPWFAIVKIFKPSSRLRQTLLFPGGRPPEVASASLAVAQPQGLASLRLNERISSVFVRPIVLLLLIVGPFATGYSNSITAGGFDFPASTLITLSTTRNGEGDNTVQFYEFVEGFGPLSNGVCKPLINNYPYLVCGSASAGVTTISGQDSSHLIYTDFATASIDSDQVVSQAFQKTTITINVDTPSVLRKTLSQTYESTGNAVFFNQSNYFVVYPPNFSLEDGTILSPGVYKFFTTSGVALDNQCCSDLFPASLSATTHLDLELVPQNMTPALELAVTDLNDTPTNTIRPNLLLVNSLLLHKYIRRNDQALKVQITGAPKAKVRVYLQRSSASGGHIGNDGPHLPNPPHGWLATYPVTLPCFIPFEKPEPNDCSPKATYPGPGTLAHSSYEDRGAITLDDMGFGIVEYIAPEICGDETIFASIDGRTIVSAPIHISEPLSAFANLDVKPGPSGNFVDEGKTYHSSNHWVTVAMQKAIERFMTNYKAEALAHPKSLPTSLLPVNDTSLVNGGVFDVGNKKKKDIPPGNWNIPHKGHRVGDEADIGVAAPPQDPVTLKLGTPPWPVFHHMWQDQGFFAYIPEGTSHYHLLLNGPGKVAMAELLPQVNSFDGETIDLTVPLQNQGGLYADNVQITSVTAGQGVQITSPLVSPTDPLPLGPADIRATVPLHITATVPQGLSKFDLKIQGEATSAELPSEWFAVPGVVNPPEKYYVKTNGAGAFQRQKNLSLSTSGDAWGITLNDPDQGVIVGATTVFHGTITNATGGPIPIQTANVFYEVSSEAGAYTFDLDPQFTALGGFIPTDGYTGPLFDVVWVSDLPVAAEGSVSFALEGDPSTGLDPAEVTADLSYNPQMITNGGVANGRLTLTWPLEASSLVLETADDLDDPGWTPVDAPVTQETGLNKVVLNAPMNTTYYRLANYGPASLVGESAILTIAGTPASQLLNISTRLGVGTGENVLIGGFIINGTQPKKVILRGIGPSLESFGIPNFLADPVLELHKPDGSVVTDDNWKDTQQAEIQSTGIAPSNDNESAIVATLDPGAYTVVLQGKNQTTGVALVEAYDLDQGADSALANISSRGFVSSGDNVMVGGVIAGGGGGGTCSVVIRAIGPSLAEAGVENALPDPSLELYDTNGALIESAENWIDEQSAAIQNVQLEPADGLECALLAVLPPGPYTAIVRGKDNTTGVALVEVYNVSP
ncbi:MAG: hypothetical protein ACR2II_04670 [Chthoniobacterales bacterium]